MRRRLRSIDTFRGICITWMIIGHTMGWWIQPKDYYTIFFIYINIFVDAFGSAGFLFISGMSLTLSYKKNLENLSSYEDYEYKQFRSEYLLRAWLLFLIGFAYNFIMVLRTFNIKYIYSWFILQTLPVSMILFWPFFKSNIFLKILFAITILILNEILYLLLIPFQDNFNSIFVVIYYFMYNQVELSPLFRFFPFFIIGSIIADLIYSKIWSDANYSKKVVLTSFTIPMILIGFILIFISLCIIPFDILERFNLSWPVYAIGGHLLIFAILFSVEFLTSIKIQVKYRFFYYFSYYSFTIFLLHYPLYFLFTNRLSAILFLPLLLVSIIIIRIFLGLMYRKYGSKFSLKYQLRIISTELINYFKKTND
ncbi:MAG: heparan-alpha-glucosaminide N-acetyltransferase domain-containing protein [Promethearchaeati archaeon]